MNLISTTDFVLNKEKDFNNGKIGFKEFTNDVSNYANFLKKPLEIGMFINPISEPSVDAYMQPKEVDKQYSRYNEAKDKLIFKTLIERDTALFHISQKRTVEYFVPFDLELSETVVKRIFGGCH